MQLELGGAIGYGAFGIEKRLRAFRKLVNLSGTNLLDVGCGNGAYTMAMAPSFSSVKGIDVESERLNSFGEHLTKSPQPTNISIHKMSADHLLFPSDTFDVVTAIEVLEHIAQLDLALLEIARVLKPTGVFCITCPNKLFPLETHHVRLPIVGKFISGKWFPFLPYFSNLHARYSTARNFTTSSLEAILIRAGLKLVAVDYVMPPFDGWKWARWLLRPLAAAIERTPLRIFGVSIIGIAQRASANRPAQIH